MRLRDREKPNPSSSPKRAYTPRAGLGGALEPGVVVPALEALEPGVVVPALEEPIVDCLDEPKGRVDAR